MSQTKLFLSSVVSTFDLPIIFSLLFGLAPTVNSIHTCFRLGESEVIHSVNFYLVG